MTLPKDNRDMAYLPGMKRLPRASSGSSDEEEGPFEPPPNAFPLQHQRESNSEEHTESDETETDNF
jgi:hypothetical protein